MAVQIYFCGLRASHFHRFHLALLRANACCRLCLPAWSGSRAGMAILGWTVSEWLALALVTCHALYAAVWAWGRCVTRNSREKEE